MEQLENELHFLMKKMNNKEEFQNILEHLKVIEPFNKYDFIISKLLSENIISYDDYIKMRDDYIFRNLFLYVFEITSPRGFGDTWAFSHLMTIEPLLKHPTKHEDPDYKGQYDLYLPHNGEIIKIEIKASRANDRNKSDAPLYEKALDSNSNKKFLMNFQQLKPSCCDVYIWLAVYRDKIRYWVMKNTIIQNHKNFCPQHRNEETETREKTYDRTKIFEGQIMITNENINSIAPYEVESFQLRQAIIEQFES